MLLRASDGATEDEWRSFLRTHDFGQLVLPGKGRPLPLVVPAHFVLRGGEALMHFVRTNPLWSYVDEDAAGLLCVVGAYAYIPSDVNGGVDDPAGFGVPTSYYAAVQLEGRCQPVDEPEELADLLQRMVDHFEPGGERGRQPVTTAPPDGPQLRAIRGLRFHITGTRAKFKFGGNRTARHREQVAEFLEGRGGDLDREAAALARSRRPA